jgi:anti-anti-sigma regulatory factor
VAVDPAGAPLFAAHLDVGVGRLTVTGRLDVRTSHLLYDAFSALLLTERSDWTVDVARLVVVDHAGLRSIAASYRRAVRHQRRITLHGASPVLQHALARMRLDGHVLPDMHAREAERHSTSPS